MERFQDIDHDLAALSTALAHPARVRLVRLLLQLGEAPVKELVARLPLSQATVSQHLKVLREAGVVVARPEGRTVRYSLHGGALRRLSTLVSSLAARVR
jgi:ArsR family transcriptional regulator